MSLSHLSHGKQKKSKSPRSLSWIIIGFHAVLLLVWETSAKTRNAWDILCCASEYCRWIRYKNIKKRKHGIFDDQYIAIWCFVDYLTWIT